MYYSATQISMKAEQAFAALTQQVAVFIMMSVILLYDYDRSLHQYRIEFEQ
jgi:hypothetical protein